MIVTQNSNLKHQQKYLSFDARGHGDQNSGGGPPLLLKPTGVPVFTPVDTIKTISNSGGVLEGISTMDTTTAAAAQFEQSNQRTVRAKSFVIGKKVENQTGINLIDLDNMSNAQERPFPVKVLYVKPTFEQKSLKSKLKDSNKGQVSQVTKSYNNNNEENKENNNYVNIKGPQIVHLKDVKIKSIIPQNSAVQDKEKATEKVNLRPKSAQQTSKQIKKESIKHAKLGPNANVKPQISYVRKVQSANPDKNSQQKPIKEESHDQKRQPRQDKSQHRFAKPNADLLSPSRPVDVPFAENRLKGQFQSLTKDLFKKAQETLKEEKLKAQRQKEELQQKKEKQKQITEQVKKMNHELVIKQKEKGVERVDLRKKEEEVKEQLKRAEIKEDRQKQRELRQKRREEGRKIIGLELFDQDKIEEYRRKVKDEIQAKVEDQEKQQKVSAPPVIEQRPKSSNPVLKQLNKDMKQVMKEQVKEEEIDAKDAEELKKERQKLLKVQQKKRKQMLLEQQKLQEEERKRKEENMKLLEQQLKQQKEENLKRQEMQKKMREEMEKLARDQEEEERLQQKQKKKTKKTKKQNSSSHKEQLNELRNWIEEQMQKEDEREYDEPVIEKPQKISVKIDKKDQQNTNVPATLGQNTSFQSHKSRLSKQKIQASLDNSNLDIQNVNPIKALRFELPGNMDMAYDESQKFAVRQNRYGLYGDNGYAELVEIKRRDLEDEKAPSKQEADSSLERKQKIRLSKEGLVTMISKIQEYQKLKQERDNSNEREGSPEHKRSPRKVIFERQSEKHGKTVPGVVNIEQELKRQQQEQQLKERQAVKVIQKWARGFIARQEVREIREEKRREIEQEYGYFEDQVKFNSDYNLKKFLKEKERMRELNKTKAVFEDSINEQIGESSSLGRSGQNFKSSIGQSQSQAKGFSASNVQVNNFFNQKPTSKDPLSIIDIFTKRNAPKPSVVKSPLKIDTQNQGTMDKRRSQQRKQSSSDIEEEIYSESFIGDEEEVKSHKTGGTIEEDLQFEGSKGMSSGSHSKEYRSNQYMKNMPFNYKKQPSIAESIQEEIIMSFDRRSKRSPERNGDNSSIYEESGLQIMSASKSSYLKKESVIEESIQESIQGDGNQSHSGSSEKLNKQQLDKQRQKTLQQVSEFEIKIKADQTKRKELVNELLTEMKNYEQASVSIVVVERMEKIINNSLAQKDKILLAQRLHELELEKNHKDEINRIREEQIKLLSQLVLMGSVQQSNPNVSEKERQQMMENIQKIIEKPIIIQQQKAPSSSESEKAFEEKSEADYIEESKGLSQSRRIEDSIPESINIQKGQADDDDSIAEEIIEGTDSNDLQSEEEIKESVYADGKKVKDTKESLNTKPNINVDKGLSKMRMALGSEEAIRESSKKTLKGEDKKASNSGLFDKHSFQDFTHQKFKQLMFDEKAASAFLDEIETAIEEKKKNEESKLKADLKKNLISPRTFKRKERDLEKWVTKERDELQNKKIKMAQTYEEIGSYLSKLESEKKIMLEKIGSPRVGRRLLDSQSSLDYDEIEEESNESLRVRQARSQLKTISKNLNKEGYETKEDIELKKKKAAAKKLIEEKEKLIEDGLKSKVKELESEHVDKMLNLALKINVEDEIQKRLNRAKRVIEESSEVFESARSISQSVATEENKRVKKNVKFASPEKFSSYDPSSDGLSSKHKSSTQKLEDSIGESIKIEDSYNMSGSVPQEFNSSKRSQSNEKIKESYKDSIKESIRESVAEDQESSQAYSEDFVSQSQLSSSNNNDQNLQSKNKLQAKIDTIQDDDIGYSMNFEEDSIGQSNQLFNSLAKQNNNERKQVEQVNEEESHEEEDQDELQKSLISKGKNSSHKESDSNDIQEEEIIEGSISIGTSSKFQSSAAPPEESEAISEDKEVINSAKSIEWQINFEQLESQRSKKQSEDDERYSEDFEQSEDLRSQIQTQEKQEDDAPSQPEEIEEEHSEEEDENDELDDLESFPDEIAESFDDFQAKADKFTDEFMEILLDEIRENPDLTIDKAVDIEDFKDKWPFNLEVKEEPKVIEVKSTPSTPPKVEEKKKENADDIARAKYERETKKQQEQMKEIEQYIDLMISNINKQELIDSLERPIDIDPLKKLALIFSQEVDESQNLNETSKEQNLLTLDNFIQFENSFRIRNERVDLTESARQSYLQHINVLHKSIFDAFNQALDLERPYKDKGQPAPWSKQTRVLKPKITMKQVEQTLSKSKERVLNWSKTGAGTRIAPPPPPPPASNDYDQPSQQQQPQIPEEEKINNLREERLGMLMMKELEENENKWIDYEDEDTQVKFDLADMILEELASELASVMMNLGQNRR